MSGLPAISVPVGAVPSTHADSKHRLAAPVLPVGLQLMAPAWHEASLLHAGAVLEAAVGEAGLAPPPPGADPAARCPRV